MSLEDLYISDYEFQNEENNKKEIKHYNLLHMIDINNNYGIEKLSDEEERSQLAQYIHNNFDKMDDVEMQRLVLKCLSITRIKQILLEYELENLKPSNIMASLTLTEFIPLATKILNRYQSKAGGFCFEDNIWTLHTMQSADITLNEYTIIFENSIDKYDVDDFKTEKYISDIVYLLDNIAENIRVDVHYMKAKKDKLFLVHIRAQDINLKKLSAPKISL